MLDRLIRLVVIGSLCLMAILLLFSSNEAKFKLTLEIETPEGKKSATSVVAIQSYLGLQLLPQHGDRLNQEYSARGYAPMIEIGRHGWLLVQLDRMIGWGAHKAYGKDPTTLSRSERKPVEVKVPVRIVPADGNWGVVKLPDRGGWNSEVMSYPEDWQFLQQWTNRTVSVISIRIEPTDAALVERMPNAPEWLQSLRQAARENPARDNAAVSLRRFESGAP